MTVSLKKGQGVSLKKEDFDLSKVTIGLGWDVNEEKKDGLLGFLSSKQEEYDLDVVAFLIGENGKVNDLGATENGRPSLKNGDVIFFNSLKHHSGQIWLTGDNRTGDGDGDDEQIIVNLNALPDKFVKILFVVQIYEGKSRKQDFSKVQNAFIRAVDAKGREMVRFDLSGDSSYSNYCSLTFAELVRESKENWKFNAIGNPHEESSFVYILRNYT
ncbi:TerD family protein [Nitrosomonas communis]|uniref:TerD family protein n=1 Tax=Nitrosomonas communis TaxID=44574 RepID=UPI0026EB0546|nr:TerD family protein [Nitrosomonas communis]MCO6427624.1 TerD family protein [Nitrosomonas communis]